MATRPSSPIASVATAWLKRLPPPFLAMTLSALPGHWALNALNALISRQGMVQHRDLAYGAAPQQALDIYVPLREPGPDGHPIVVFMYGGSWKSGQRHDFLFVAQALVQRGFMVVVPDYRKYPSVQFPAFMHDVAQAVGWTMSHASRWNGNARRLAIMGHSAGAHIVTLLGTDASFLSQAGVLPTSVRAIVGLAGPYDFLPMHHGIAEVFPHALRPASQPIRCITGHESPMFLATGTTDKTVDPGNTVRMSQRLRQAGVSVEERHYDGLGHAALLAVLAAPFQRMKPVLDDIIVFLNAHTT